MTSVMDRRAFISGITLALLAAPLAAEAQQRPKTARIGFLSLSSGPTPTMDISPGLRELGWIEGQNIVVEYRWAANREDQLPALAGELVRLKVDVIVTSSTPAAQAAKRATTTIPCRDVRRRSRGKRPRGEPGPAGREHYRIDHAGERIGR